MKKIKRNFTETPNTDIVGHRFGTATCVRYVPNSKASFECVCECGNHFTAPRSALIYGRIRSCPNCSATNKRTSSVSKFHKYIIDKYGSITDYVPNDNVHCSYCGSPFIYNKKRQLCRTCNQRFNRNGSPEYIVRDTSQPTATELKIAASRERGQLRKEQARQSLDIMPNSPLATQMADMYLNQNMSYQQIADHFNCSRQYVHSLLHYHEYRTRNNKQQEIYRRRKKIKNNQK